MISVTFSGTDALNVKLDRVTKQHIQAAIRGMKQGGLYVQAQSQKIVPVDTSNLKNSAFTRVKGSGMDTTVEVGYTASYAVYVHERLDLRHKPGKQAKFLSSVFANETHRARILKFIGDAIQQVS